MRPPTGRPGVAAGALGIALVIALGGCTSGGAGDSGAPASPGGTTAADALPTGRASAGRPDPPATSRAVESTPNRHTGPVTEKAGVCPYISTQRVADIEGNRVGRSTVVTTPEPGCRFYFMYGDRHLTASISIARLPSATAAFNRVARTRGSAVFSTPGIGSAAVLYRTRFYPPDGDRDWACRFAKGTLVVTVHTDQVEPSANARNLARAVVDRI